MKGLKYISIGFVMVAAFLSCSSKKDATNNEAIISLNFGETKIDDDINMIIWGIVADEKTILIKDLPLGISFKHENNKEVCPFIFTSRIVKLNPMDFSRYYKLHKKDDFVIDSLHKRYSYDFILDSYRLYPYQEIPFPITKYQICDYNNDMTVTFTYGNKDGGKKEKLIRIFPFSLNYEGEKHTKEEAEMVFLSNCRWYLGNESPENIALVFDDKIIPRIECNKLFSEKGKKAKSLKELTEK